jgi:hypothetical protein
MGSSKQLWDEAWREISRSVCFVVLIFDHLRGGQGIISDRFNGTFLQIYFLRFRLRCGVHIFSFDYCSPFLGEGGVRVKKYSVRPNWDER